MKISICLCIGDKEYHSEIVGGSEPITRDNVPDGVKHVIEQVIQEFNNDKKGYLDHYKNPEVRN